MIVPLHPSTNFCPAPTSTRESSATSIEFGSTASSEVESFTVSSRYRLVANGTSALPGNGLGTPKGCGSTLTTSTRGLCALGDCPTARAALVAAVASRKLLRFTSISVGNWLPDVNENCHTPDFAESD